MGRIEKTVFISYRRTNVPWALAIYQNLTMHGYDVFIDYQDIDSGNFEKVILENIKARAHFLVILTPSALERCKEPGDWLRREIETAMDEKRNIVPLMLESFDFGSPLVKEALTGKLASLSQFNGLRVYSEYFFEAMDKLRNRYMNVGVSEIALTKLNAEAMEITETQKIAANEAAPVEKEELTAQEWFERGYIFQEANNLDETIRCYTEVMRLKPDDADAYNNRGIARRTKGDLDGAIKDYNKAIRLKPDDADAYNNRGVALRTRGDIAGAIKDYSKAIRLKLDDAIAYDNRGNARRDKGDLDGAIKDYNKAIRLKSDDADAYNNRGNARRDKGDLDGAIKDYNKAIRLKSDDVDTYNNRGNVYFKKGELEKAIRDFEEAIRLQPDFKLAHVNLELARSGKK
ncbi:MAG: tetratricopeptide repeat protein [Chloroflexi bacterium]|nr:MAG: tetratricopeptide repeat protein [Chloroflexota bacterium]